MLAPTLGIDWPRAGPIGTGGVWTDLLTLGREGEMRWRVMVELSGAEGAIELREVSVGACTAAACSAETLGLTVADGKKTLAGLQSHLVGAQTEEHCRSRRRCQHCGAQRPLKDIRSTARPVRAAIIPTATRSSFTSIRA